MTVQPGSPIPDPGNVSGPQPPAAPAAAGSPKEQAISKTLLDSMNRLYQATQNPQIQTTGVHRISEDKKIDIADKITQIAIKNGITPEEIQQLLDDGVLDLQTFIDNELLIDTYSNIIQNALHNMQFTAQAGLPGITRETVIKVVTSAFKAEVMHSKGAVISTPSGDFLVRLKAKQNFVYAIPLSAMQAAGRGAFSVAYKVNELVDLDPIVFKVVEPKNLMDRQRTIEEVYNEVKILKSVHIGGYVEGIKPAPHAVVGIVGGKSSNAPAEVPGAKNVGVLEEAYEGNLHMLLDNQWDTDWSNGNYHMSERVDMCERLLNGLSALHAVGRSHGDLKLLNVLYKTENGQVVGDISDFGTSLSEEEAQFKIDNPNQYPKFKTAPWGGNTSAYVSQDDCYKELDAVENNDMEELIDIQMSRDVFSLGIALVHLLTGIPGYDTVEIGIKVPGQGPGSNKEVKVHFADLSTRLYAEAFDAVFDTDTSETLKPLFDAMLNPDWESRCSAEYARDAFTYFKSHYPFTVQKP